MGLTLKEMWMGFLPEPIHLCSSPPPLIKDLSQVLSLSSPILSPSPTGEVLSLAMLFLLPQPWLVGALYPLINGGICTLACLTTNSPLAAPSSTYKPSLFSSSASPWREHHIWPQHQGAAKVCKLWRCLACISCSIHAACKQ